MSAAFITEDALCLKYRLSERVWAETVQTLTASITLIELEGDFDDMRVDLTTPHYLDPTTHI